MKRVLIVLALIPVLLCAPAAGAENATVDSQEDEDEGSGLDLGEVVGAVDNLINDFESFTSNWDDKLAETVEITIFGPFKSLLKYLIEIIAAVLLHTPDVHGNPGVSEVYHQSLLIAYLLTGTIVTAAGLLHITGPVLGVSYQQARQILPKTIAAAIFSSVSLPLLQYAVDLTNALVHAFRPDGLEASLSEMFGTSTVLAIVWVVNSSLLLLVVVIFVVRAVYVLFVAAISPLIAMAWSLPMTKPYADSFIGGWFTALAMAPIDMIALKFSFSMMTAQGATFGQALASWVYGMGAAVLMLWIPYQLYGASQAAISQAYGITNGVKNRFRKYKAGKRHQERLQSNQEKAKFYSRVNRRMRRRDRLRNRAAGTRTWQTEEE